MKNKIKKNLRKLCLGLFAVVLTTSYVSAQLTFGARAGFIYTTLTVESDGIVAIKEYRNKFKSGFQIGIVADYALGEFFSIQPGLLFAQQGFKNVYPEVKTTTNLNYLQVPVNFQYKHPLDKIDILIQTGPYLGFGINGKSKYWDENRKRMPDKDFKISFGNDREKDDFKCFDFGIGVGAGLQFGNIQAGFGYNIGIRNLNIKRSAYKYGDKTIMKIKGLALTVTYLFGN